MKRAGGLAVLGLLLSNAAAGAEGAACGIRKGLYEEWLALEKHSSSHKGLKLISGAKPAVADPGKEESIGGEYQAYFQCLSEKVSKKKEEPEASLCDGAAGDRLATFVCQTVAYVKEGRTASKEFIDAFPAGKRAGEMIWDLDTIASLESTRDAAIFAPRGPAYKAIDELFVLVLDDREAAVSKYFNIAGAASDAGARYMDEQIKALLLEAPSVIVKEWPIVRQYLPMIRKLLAGMKTADTLRVRTGVAAFCTKDNLDCPEILKTFGKPE